MIPTFTVATSSVCAIRWWGARALGWWVVIALATAGLRAEEVPPVWIATAPLVSAGVTASVWLNYLNSTETPVTRSFPAKVPCRIQASSSELRRDLTLRNQTDAGDATIPAGGFARREYLIELPAVLTGRVWLSIEQVGANPLAWEMVPPILTSTPSSSTETTVSTNETRAAKSLPPGGPDSAVEFFKTHFFPHEPLYFIAGTKSPNAKFQISFKYQLFLGEGWMAEHAPLMTNLFAGYTQVSLWDWNKASAPFYDSNYKPEMLCAVRAVERGEWWDWFRLEVAGGLQHESNGRDGLSSRSINIAYLRPSLIFGQPDGLQLTLTPRGWVYLGDLSDNPDIGNYRGHVELRVVAGWERGLQLTSMLHAADGLRHGSAEVGLSYPLWAIPALSASTYFYAQYFTGYGESLLSYNQRSSIFRAGFSLFR